MLFVSSLCLGTAWTDAEAYGSYKGVRSQAQTLEEKGEFKSAYILYLQAASIAEKYATTRIAAWQYNNAAFCMIKDFKTTLDGASLRSASDALAKAEALDPDNETIQKNISYCKFYRAVIDVARDNANNGGVK
jgi:hypothetical protein